MIDPKELKLTMVKGVSAVIMQNFSKEFDELSEETSSLSIQEVKDLTAKVITNSINMLTNDESEVCEPQS